MTQHDGRATGTRLKLAPAILAATLDDRPQLPAGCEPATRKTDRGGR